MRVIVVGGGVLGAMHALWAHDTGHQIVHLEREPAARGAAVRNFGLIWVSGPAPGEEILLAQAARDLWAGVAEKIPAVGLREHGSLTVARTEEELLVMKEAASSPDAATLGRGLQRDHRRQRVPPQRTGARRAAGDRSGPQRDDRLPRDRRGNLCELFVNSPIRLVTDGE